jgi:xanthine dehydrogenase accessory factor
MLIWNKQLTDLPTVWIRGAGEMGSAVAVSLHRVGFNIVLSDLAAPLAIRRTVIFAEAMISGQIQVEELSCMRLSLEELQRDRGSDHVAIVLDDPEAIVNTIQPWAMVDARLLKRAFDLRKFASVTVGLGPGFEAGEHCDVVIETQRGHNLGRIIWHGQAAPNTGIPGAVGGESEKRVIHSPVSGFAEWSVNIGDIVTMNQHLGVVESLEILAPIGGMVRGLISPDTPIEKGMKIADVDPRGESIENHLISDKARAIGRGVLEAMLVMRNRNQES